MKTHKPTPERLDGPGRHDPHLSILRNHIDIKRVPFSDRGSRLLKGTRPEPIAGQASRATLGSLAMMAEALGMHAEGTMWRGPVWVNIPMPQV